VLEWPSKLPKIDYKKIDGFKSFSDFHKDAIYTVALIKKPILDFMTNTYFDEQSTKFIQKSSQITTEKDFDIVP
jgi:hypothetical protein